MHLWTDSIYLWPPSFLRPLRTLLNYMFFSLITYSRCSYHPFPCSPILFYPPPPPTEAKAVGFKENTHRSGPHLIPTLQTEKLLHLIIFFIFLSDAGHSPYSPVFKMYWQLKKSFSSCKNVSFATIIILLNFNNS